MKPALKLSPAPTSARRTPVTTTRLPDDVALAKRTCQHCGRAAYDLWPEGDAWQCLNRPGCDL